jgi:drug/metabolite transporter (DMT)-like permease
VDVASALALLSSVLWGTGDFLGGTLSRRLPPAAVVGWSQSAALLAFGLVALGTGAWAAEPGYLPWAVAAGVAGPLGLVAFYSALARGTMGIVAPIAALGVVVPVAAGLLAGERPSALQIVGVVVSIAGAVLASGPEVRGGTGAGPVVLAAVAGVCFGLALLFLARGSEHDPLMTLVGMRATAVLALVVVAVARRSAGGVARRDLPALVTIGVFDGAANLAYSFAATTGLLSLVAVLSSLYPAVTILLARFVHGERLAPVQQAGVGAALVGVALIAAGG